MTLRLSPIDDANLARLAKAFHTSKNLAAAAAIDLAAPRPDHTEFVRRSTERLMARYAGVLHQLAES